MKLATLDVVIVLVYLAGIFALAQWVSREKAGHQKSTTDYFLASRSLPWWAIGASLIAANISAEQIIGMSGSGYAIGLAIAQALIAEQCPTVEPHRLIRPALEVRDRGEIVARAGSGQAVVEPVGDAQGLTQPALRVDHLSPLEPDHAEQIERPHTPVEVPPLGEAAHGLVGEGFGEVQLAQAGCGGRRQQAGIGPCGPIGGSAEALQRLAVATGPDQLPKLVGRVVAGQGHHRRVRLLNRPGRTG